MIHNESTLQYLLWRHHNFKPLFCNVHLRINEFDAIHITQAGYAIGYEIKCSKSDFKADFKKERHEILSNANRSNSVLGINIKSFYFVTGNFDLTIDEVPAYAGLMVASNHHLSIVKAAPTLGKEKVNADSMLKLYKKLALRHAYHTMEKCRSQYDKLSPPSRIESFRDFAESIGATAAAVEKDVLF